MRSVQVCFLVAQRIGDVNRACKTVLPWARTPAFTLPALRISLVPDTGGEQKEFTPYSDLLLAEHRPFSAPARWLPVHASSKRMVMAMSLQNEWSWRREPLVACCRTSLRGFRFFCQQLETHSDRSVRGWMESAFERSVWRAWRYDLRRKLSSRHPSPAPRLLP